MKCTKEYLSGQITTFQTSQNKIYKEARVKLSNKVEIHYNGKYKSEPVKAKLPPRQIRAAFYVNWDAQRSALCAIISTN